MSDAPESPESFYYVSGQDVIPIRASELALQQSTVIGEMISKLEGSEKPIKLDNIDGPSLKIVMDWCEHHKGEPIPAEDHNIPKQVDIPEWDKNILDSLDGEELFNLVMAAYHLDIKQLLTYCCKTVAMMAKGKSPEELRIIYMIPTDEEDEIAEMEAKERLEREAAAREAGEGPSH
ncbi:hypothetical protein B9Z55_008582 [Caenorhabditis nigoni]|uniref:Skp1-related protein n=1 Tax=Caenorhabditis nigoni TaxID=1611254 RepID=A0A2G5UNC9_9PELO|nr:hypothetical protein B9Z55_008582 [Caenorhabditis nigoni]